MLEAKIMEKCRTLGIVLIGIFIGYLSCFMNKLLFSLISFCIVFVIFISNLSIFLPLLLMLRSSLDITTNIAFHLGPMKLNSAGFLALLIAFAGLLYLLMRFVKKKLFLDTISKIWIFWLISLIPWVFLSLGNLGTRGIIGLRDWVRLFSIFVIYFLVFNIVNPKNYKRYIKYLFLSLILPMGVAYYQLITHSGPLSGGIRRVYGTMAHPIHLGLYLVLFISLTFWKIKNSNKKKYWVALLILEIFILLFTFSWVAYIMFGVMIFFVFYKEKRLRIPLAVLIIVSLLLLSRNESFQYRFNRLIQTNISKTVKEGVSVNSFTWRILNWKQLLGKWREKPLLGYGFMTSELINPFTGFSPHSDFIRYLVELGVIGFSIYIIFIFVLGKKIYLLYKRANDPMLKSLLFFIFIPFLAWQIGSASDNFITSTTFQFYFWSFLGIASKMSVLEEISRNE